MGEFEQKIIDTVNQKLNEGTVERLIEEKLEKGISDALNDIFGYSGSARKMLRKKIDETMIPVIEQHNYTVMTENPRQSLTLNEKKVGLGQAVKIVPSYSSVMKIAIWSIG